MKIKHLLEEAKFYFLSQKYDLAEKFFKEVLKEDPGNKEALFNLALLYEVTNQFDQAKEYFEKVLEVDPSNKEAREHLDKLTEL